MSVTMVTQVLVTLILIYLVLALPTDDNSVKMGT